jgi:hypothetical protein
MRAYRLAVLVPLLIAATRAAFPQGEPLGPEFRVNTDTFQANWFSSVAAAGGGFVVAWQSAFGDGNDGGIRAQRYDSAGSPLGTEFRVNTYAYGTQAAPAVGANASGGFVVVWHSNSSAGPIYDVLGQRYDASGAPAGQEFSVAVGAYQVVPAVAVAPSGSFMVVWYKTFYVPPDPPLPGDVYARLFDSSGVPQGSAFRVNTFTTGFQLGPSVAADPTGNFIVVWSSFMDESGTPGGSGVFGQRYAASGAPLGPEFRVNSYTPGNQYGHAVATDPSGNFVVAWTSESSGNPPEPGLFAQRFASSGAPLGPEFRVNTSTNPDNYDPAIAFDGGGNFVVVWDHNPAYLEGEVFGQRYSSLGEPSGPEFRVNTTTTLLQRRPSVASTLDGTFLVTWESGTIVDNPDVFGQRFGGIFPVELMRFGVE